MRAATWCGTTACDMDRERWLMQALFAISIAIVLMLSMVPAIAQAPEMVIIKPLAVCVDGKCTMSEKDYLTLQRFHSGRMVALTEAGEVIERLQEQVAYMMQIITRYAMGCDRKKT